MLYFKWRNERYVQNWIRCCQNFKLYFFFFLFFWKFDSLPFIIINSYRKKWRGEPKFLEWNFNYLVFFLFSFFFFLFFFSNLFKKKVFIIPSKCRSINWILWRTKMYFDKTLWKRFIFIFTWSEWRFEYWFHGHK